MKRTGKVLRRISIALLVTVMAFTFAAVQSTKVLAAASAALSVSSGPPGTSVTVSGSGFGAPESGIYVTFDSTSVITGIATTTGSWSSSFTVPASASGIHTVTVIGPTSSTSIALSFAVTSIISLSKSSGTPGSSVTVNGAGFAASETGIKIIFDGSSIVTGISAGSNGSWSKAFTVPSVEADTYSITASGNSTSTVTAVTFTVSGGLSLNKTSGPPGTSITVTGAGFASGETGIVVTFDSTQIASGITAGQTGGWTAKFTVPPSAGGYHVVAAYGSVTTTGSVPSVSFNTTATITLNKYSGAPGAAITVSGTGFGAGEAGIIVTFDDTPVISDITANSNGAWSKTFTVPPSNSGLHSLEASGTVSTSIDINFNIGAAISVSKSSGPPGTSITVSGAGFDANETGISITFDGTPLTSDISANATGSWNANFIVPSAASGSHSIGASGTKTSAGSISGTNFNVSATVTVDKASGVPSSPITMTGSGFAANETGIKITFDGNAVASNISADVSGSWTSTFNIPPAGFGAHALAASGSSTAVISSTQFSLNVTPSVILTPATGYVNSPVNISGNGFAVNSSFRITYDGTEIAAAGAVTDGTGSINQTITIPVSKAGNHSIALVDAQGNNVKVSFTISNKPPAVPSGVSPKDRSTISVTGNITPTFKWTDISASDPNGVSYVLQIDTSPDFPEPVVNKANIPTNHYTLKASEALPRGQYYWRLKAVDAASNESAWSEVLALKSGVMAAWLLVLIIILAVAVIGAGIYFGVVRTLLMRRRETITVSEIEAPMFSPGQFQALESGEAPKEREAPRRMALPEVSKSAKTLSTEDQARLKLIMDFAQSMPLVEPDYSVKWLVDLIENQLQTQISQAVYEQVLKGELQAHYEPAWKNHPVYKDLISMLQKQPVLQKLDAFINDTGRCEADAISLIQQIYRQAASEIPQNFMERGAWNFTSAIYIDALNWHSGKSLTDPSERDYVIEQPSEPDKGPGGFWLSGSSVTLFAGHLISANDQPEAIQLRSLHMKLRRSWRNDEKSRSVSSAITRLLLQRNELLNALSQFGRTR